MAASRMYIEKFGREVLIDDDHPLAIAQREQDAAGTVSSASSAPAGENLDAMTKDELATLAESLGIPVVRADGGDGPPRKSDYIAALRV